MKLSKLVIQNFRSCKAVEINVSAMHAIVGANNAGKSTILRALDFLFNASVRGLNEESFWNKDVAREIRVEAVFTGLTAKETEQLGAYLRDDGSFHMARVAAYRADEESGNDEDEGDERIKVSQQYCKPLPKVDWLRESNTNAKSIVAWLKDEPSLVLRGHNFLDAFGGKKPTVEQWKEAARNFIKQHLQAEDLAPAWEDNPRGYAGVLKGTLPFFVLVPAVRDISEEAKVLKTNPFGRLLAAVMNAIAAEKRAALEATLQGVAKQLNRAGGAERLPEIGAVEQQLNQAIGRVFADCDLEIEFQTPTFENLISAPRLYADDGFRGQIEFKGHGLQRAVIFAILRNYADLVTGKGDAKHRTLILAVEEPELYMHPLAQRAIRRLFKEISGGGDQIFFTTHSALQVDVADFDEVIRVETESVTLPGDKKAVCSKIRQLPVSSMVNDELARHPHLAGKVTAVSIRDYYSNAYNRSRNEGFFAKRVVLVEGLTEEYALPIFATALSVNLDLLGIAVIECGGKGAMDRLYRVFNELGIPTFLLFDYDRSNAEPEIVAKSRELLELVGEPPDAPDALRISARIACFKETWEQDTAPEISDYAELLTQARKVLGKTAGKPMIARFIARELARRQPAFVPPGIKAILEKVVAVACGPTCLKKP